MLPIRRAVIDVGTNSVKLLVADVATRNVRPVHEESAQTRLGQGFYNTHQLQPKAIAQTAEVVARFARTARDLNAQSVRVIATSAARDAINPGDLTSAIGRACELKVEIISGEQEADWAFQGVTSDPQLAGRPLLLLDVGGGSTEFIFGRGERTDFRQSFPLGTVRLMEKIPHSDPPTRKELGDALAWVKKFLNERVRPTLEPALRREGRTPKARRQLLLVGTGGTATILARMEVALDTFDRARIEATRLNRERVLWHLTHLWALPLEKRKKVVGLPANRADVILTGVLIYEAVMELFDFSELRVSTRGLRFAAIMDGA
jgi:exopolyphosphatase/guanosine-5'-triphosphate,3'-diphosphate pyrophosphatase